MYICIRLFPHFRILDLKEKTLFTGRKGSNKYIAYEWVQNGRIE